MDNIEKTNQPIWGPWATLGFGIFIGAAFLIVGLIVAVIYLTFALQGAQRTNANILALDLKANGTFASWAGIITAAICLPLILAIIRLRRGQSTKDYLKLYRVSGKALLFWIGLIIVWAVAQDLITDALNCESGAELMRKTYDTAGILPLLWIAICLAGPLFEEIFVRGFLFTGWERSRLGAIGTILLTSALWAVTHAQYQWCEISIVFISGLILGISRVKTGSIYPAILMHCVINLMGTIQVAMGW